MFSMRNLLITLCTINYAAASPIISQRTVPEGEEPPFPVDKEAQAKAYTRSPTSNVKGKVFDRVAIIWLENTDYAKAKDDPNLKWLASQGIKLSGYHAVSHPSQPNYVAAGGGDFFGIINSDIIDFPEEVASVVDLLEDKGISWGAYQEDMPYTGFLGGYFKNPVDGSNAYVRKHNPLVSYKSVTGNPERLACLKNLTMFHEDLKANKLPQYMFITPNMMNDGHDTSVTYAGNWTQSFLKPLLSNKNFMKNTLVLVTFDETEQYTIRNNVYGFLLGDAVPSDLRGTKDTNFYTHYSAISTVEANWGLKTLGRYDYSANVFEFVGKKTGDKPIPVDTTNVLLNEGYPGFFNPDKKAPLPVPNIYAKSKGKEPRGVLDKIIKTFKDRASETVYGEYLVVPPSAKNPPVYPKGSGQ